jgi:hypothetical protein
MSNTHKNKINKKKDSLRLQAVDLEVKKNKTIKTNIKTIL